LKAGHVEIRREIYKITSLIEMSLDFFIPLLEKK